MEDIESGQVDCVVVYKVDRLSRSLLDFARLIGMFEEHGVSLVSVTQQLNTTDSLGRLTLNILLSFAQFERELIAERTRDKMRAARRKGKWLGGQPILGYDVDPERGGLKINAGEAPRVGFIFQQIAEGKSAHEVLDGLSRRSWSTKQWVSRSGRQHPGRAFKVSDLVRLVQNVMYVGKLRDGEQIYQGAHAGIIDAELWERANTAFKRWRAPARDQSRNSSPNGTAERKAEVSQRPSVTRISRLLALALKMEQMIQEGTVKNYSGLAHLGQVSRAREALDRAEEIADRTADDHLRAYVLQNRAELELSRGNAEQARALADRSIESPNASNRSVALSKLIRAEAIATTKATDAVAIRVYDEALRALEPHGRRLLARGYQSLFAAMTRRGRLKEANQAAQRSLELLQPAVS